LNSLRLESTALNNFMNKIQGLEDYKLKEIQNITLSHIGFLRESFHFEDLDFFLPPNADMGAPRSP